MSPSSVYTDAGIRITNDIDDAEFYVLCSITSVTCNSGSGSGYGWPLLGASPKGRFWPKFAVLTVFREPTFER